ncbi:hypothetical protein BGX38DRAFT_1161348 [Terfezia claveryi]|nr:hypothetical protein BGX38DRAFT_1161348 [Terfezia claveryi]
MSHLKHGNILKIAMQVIQCIACPWEFPFLRRRPWVGVLSWREVMYFSIWLSRGPQIQLEHLWCIAHLWE